MENKKNTTKVFRPIFDKGMDIIDLSIEDLVDELYFLLEQFVIAP